MKMNKFIIIGVALIMFSCGNGGKNDKPIDGGHGIGIDTATVHEIERYEDSLKAKNPINESPKTVSPSLSSSSHEDQQLDNMRGFDPASEDDMHDNGMTRYMEVNDEEGWD